MLGASALAHGCSKPSTELPDGELLGQSLEIGHKLREGFRPRPAEAAWQDIDIAIVGGGASGLSAAWKLRKSGRDDFVVLELETVPGGTSRSANSKLSAYPWGAHYVPVPFAENRELNQLFVEMGVVEGFAADGSPIVAEQYLCRDPEERLYCEGKWIEGLYPATGASSDDALQAAAFRAEVDRWVDFRDASGQRAFVTPTSLASRDPAVTDLDRISMSDWLIQHGFTSTRLLWQVNYACRDDYGLTADETSAWAGLLYFAARLKAPGAEPQPFITWADGNGSIIGHLSHGAGTRLKTGMAVTQITPTTRDGKDCVEVICYDTRTDQVTGYRARHVISALPQFLTSRLIDGFAVRTGRRTNEFEYGSWIVANLHLRDRPREHGFPLCWDNVIHGSQSLGYVVATHQSGRDHGPTILTWYYPLCGGSATSLRKELLGANWSDLAEVVLTDLERPHPEIRKLTSRLDIFRWGHAMVRPKPGFITSQQRIEAQRADGRIHFANTDLSGIALFEEAFDHGCRAAMEVISQSGAF